MSENQTTTPHPVDVYVGQQIRVRRRLIGMSQDRLAEKLGVSFQQVQKYENGMNRVSCSRLVMAAAAMKCTPADLLPSAAIKLEDVSLNPTGQLAAIPGGLDIAEHFLAMDKGRRVALLTVAAILLDGSTPPTSAIAAAAAEVHGHA